MSQDLCVRVADDDGKIELAIGTPKASDDNDGELVLMFLKANGGWSDYSILYPWDIGIGAEDDDDVTNAQLGWAVAWTGDLNKDGVNDLVVSSRGLRAASPYYDGAIHFISLTSDGKVDSFMTLNASSVNLTDTSTSPYFGDSLATMGDWDGDGRVEVLVGAPYYKGGAIVRIQVELGDGGGLHATRSHLLLGEDVNGSLGDEAYFGGSVAFIDNRTIVVGAPDAGCCGEVWILSCDEDFKVVKKVRIDTTGLDLSQYDEFGHSVAVIGNMTSSNHPLRFTDLDQTTQTVDLLIQRNP